MARILSVNISTAHDFSKRPVERIEVVEGIGVRGDAHSGVAVQHLSRIEKDPTSPICARCT